MKPLYREEGKFAICQICGREIYRFGTGYGLVSHARKHVREGLAIEEHTPSTRCYNGYDTVFFIKEGD